MIHTFIHEFSNGKKMKMEFDMSTDAPTCKIIPADGYFTDLNSAPKEILDEYVRWSSKVLLPTIAKLCNPAQLNFFSKIAFEK